MIRRPPRSTLSSSSAASDVYKRQAVDGNENAIEKLLLFYEAYISKCCLRPFYDEYGNVYIVVDMELKGRIREALLKMICEFEIDEH